MLKRSGLKSFVQGANFVRISPRLVQDTALTMEPRRLWRDLCLATTDQLDHRWTFEAENLIADRVTPVVEAAVWFFDRFNWTNPTKEVLRQDVEAFRTRR